MIKAKLSNGTIILGLSKRNIELLMQKKPIVVNLKDLELEDRNVIIAFGESEEKLYEEMLEFIDINKTKFK